MNTSPASREAATRAYEFALNRIGQDKDSGEIWSDYIQFLRVGEVLKVNDASLEGTKIVMKMIFRWPGHAIPQVFNGEFERSSDHIIGMSR